MASARKPACGTSVWLTMGSNAHFALRSSGLEVAARSITAQEDSAATRSRMAIFMFFIGLPQWRSKKLQRSVKIISVVQIEFAALAIGQVDAAALLPDAERKPVRPHHRAGQAKRSII